MIPPEARRRAFFSESGAFMKPSPVVVVGAGLAGSEAAFQIARRGVPVRLFEMRPVRTTPAHRTPDFAELVCSNSLKSLDRSTAHGLLKEELTALGSMIVAQALAHRVPAGGALAVDREQFARAVTETVTSHPLIEVVRQEVPAIPEDGIVILAVGPLVSDALAASIAEFTGEGHLHFFDAIAPVLEADSIDRSIAFAASRYDKGGGDDYLNCPMTQAEYEAFVAALLAGEKAPLHEFDTTPFFEGCLPIEEMARRGVDTLRFGPMKPVGLRDPKTGERPHAVVQLRQDNLAAEHYSMVGFQTQLRWPSRSGSSPRSPAWPAPSTCGSARFIGTVTINAPRLLNRRCSAASGRSLFFAGQIAGVEGYTESAATGLLAGINAARLATGREPVTLPVETMLGALARYVTTTDPENYQPTNAAFGLLPEAPGLRGKKKDRRESPPRRWLSARCTRGWARAASPSRRPRRDERGSGLRSRGGPVSCGPSRSTRRVAGDPARLPKRSHAVPRVPQGTSWRPARPEASTRWPCGGSCPTCIIKGCRRRRSRASSPRCGPSSGMPCASEPSTRIRPTASRPRSGRSCCPRT
jgi:methylenetetrahydrofolate--tRNA-(uracil-5-)-methyltransferase